MTATWAQAETRGVLYTNRATCQAQMGQHSAVVADCTAALALGKAIKPRIRRALAHEVRPAKRSSVVGLVCVCRSASRSERRGDGA